MKCEPLARHTATEVRLEILIHPDHRDFGTRNSCCLPHVAFGSGAKLRLIVSVLFRFPLFTPVVGTGRPR
jgi:hypothetical protein